jgi:uncharacterized protein (TIGR02246 family)
MNLRVALLGLAPILVLAACAPQPAPDTSEADAETIRTSVAQFVVAWNAGNDATLGTLVAEDAVLMEPDSPAIEGRDAILATMAEGYDIALMQQSATTDEVIVMGDYAYARGTWNLDLTSAATEDMGPENGKWSTLFRRGPDGAWQIWRWMWNEPSDAAPADG